MTTTASSEELILYARRFGHAIANQYPRYRDDIVSASLLGAAVAFDSPDFPADPEGQRKFVGACCWNLMQRELTFLTKKQPTSFSDLAEDLILDPVVEETGYGQVDWEDTYELLAENLVGRTRDVFVRAYGRMLPPAEIAKELGINPSCVHKHLNKIADVARERDAFFKHH